MNTLFRRLLLISVSGLITLNVSANDLWTVYQGAKTYDPQLRIAQANRAARGETRPQALAALRPSITLSGQLGYQQQRTSLASSDNYANNSLALNLKQPLYRRAAWLALAQVDKQLAQTDMDYQAAEQAVMVRTAQAYFGVLAAQDELSFAQREKTAIVRQLDQAQQRFEVGLVAITDVHEAQARFDQASANQLSAENALDNRWEALREITRQQPTKLAGLTPQINLAMPEPASLQAWSERAQQQNLAIQSAELATAIAQDNIAIQQSERYPTVDLSATLSRTDSQATTGMTINTNQIGLQMHIPLYLGGGLNSRIQQARYQHQATMEQLSQQQRAVDRQVRNAYRGIQTSIGRVSALAATQTSAQSALDATQAGFEAGTRTLVDVLNSQRDLYRTKRDYAQSRYNYVLNTLLLLQATGTLAESDLQGVNAWLAN